MYCHPGKLNKIERSRLRSREVNIQQILKVPRQLCSIANSSIFAACFSLQPYPPRLSNLGEELVYLDGKKAGWKDDCLFIFGTLEKERKRRKMLDQTSQQQIVLPRFPPSQRVALRKRISHFFILFSFVVKRKNDRKL